MKTTLLALATLALFSHAATQAQEVNPKTRADVRADTASTAKAGNIAKGEGAAATPTTKSTTKGRNEVRGEAASAEKAGTLVKGEGPAAAASRPRQANRAVVRAEAASANQSGQIGKGPDVKK